jgi:ubiquinol-cytochrome c reductase cytochrome b subunit
MCAYDIKKVNFTGLLAKKNIYIRLLEKLPVKKHKYKMRILKSHPLLSLANGYVVDSPQPSNLSYL